MGTILRTADCAGMEGLLLSEQCADIFSPKVLRATMGSIFRMPVEVTADLPGRLYALREQGYSVLSSQLDGTPFYQRRGVGERYVLVVGNEGNGVSHQVQQLATHRLRLPMRGGAESLNAAVAAGIDRAHEEISILQYNDENALSCTIHLAFYFAREYYTIVRELPAGKGFADICLIPRKLHAEKPAAVIELKWDKSAEGALAQIREKRYGEALKEYHGNLLLARISYDKGTKKHACVIERVEKA